MSNLKGSIRRSCSGIGHRIILDFGFLSYFRRSLLSFLSTFATTRMFANVKSAPSTYKKVFFGTQRESIEVGNTCVRDYVGSGNRTWKAHPKDFRHGDLHAALAEEVALEDVLELHAAAELRQEFDDVGRARDVDAAAQHRRLVPVAWRNDNKSQQSQRRSL